MLHKVWVLTQTAGLYGVRSALKARANSSPRSVTSQPSRSLLESPHSLQKPSAGPRGPAVAAR